MARFDNSVTVDVNFKFNKLPVMSYECTSEWLLMTKLRQACISIIEQDKERAAQILQLASLGIDAYIGRGDWTLIDTMRIAEALGIKIDFDIVMPDDEA